MTAQQHRMLQPRLETTVAAEPRSVPILRAAVTRFAREQGLDDECVADIALAVSEAATNAVQHAFVDRPAGAITVVAEPADGEFVVRVCDDGRGLQPRADSPGLGLGLPTIGRLCVHLDLGEGSGGVGTQVRMIFEAPGLRGPARDLATTAVHARLLREVARLADARGWPGAGISPVADLLVPALADVCVVDLVADGGDAVRVAARVGPLPEGGDPGAIEAYAYAREEPDVDRSPLRQVLESGLPCTVRLSEELRASLASSARDEEIGRQLDLAWWATVPLKVDDRVVGGIGFGFRETRPSSDDLLPLLEVIADSAAGGLANDRLITGLERTRLRLERVLGALAEAVTVTDERGQIAFANQAAADLLGAGSVDELLAATPGELAGRFVTSLEDGGELTLERLPGRQILAGVPMEPLVTRNIERATGREFWTVTTASLLDPEDRLAVNVIQDITEAKIAERRLRFLADSGRILGSSLDLEATLEQVASLAVPALADWCAVDLLGDDGELQRVALAHADPAKAAFGRQLQERYPPDLDADEGLGVVLRSGAPKLYTDIPDELLARTAHDGEHLRLLREVGLRSAILVPLQARRRTIGALTLIAAETERRFDEADLAFAVDVADRFAHAVDNARRFARLGG